MFYSPNLNPQGWLCAPQPSHSHLHTQTPSSETFNVKSVAVYFWWLFPFYIYSTQCFSFFILDHFINPFRCSQSLLLCLLGLTHWWLTDTAKNKTSITTWLGNKFFSLKNKLNLELFNILIILPSDPQQKFETNRSRVSFKQTNRDYYFMHIKDWLTHLKEVF